MGLADIHIHTNYSYDGTASVSDVLCRAKEIGLNVIAITDHDEIAGGLNVIAITDHDEIAGALKAAQLASHYGIEVIPGIEITTAEGDLLAYFINQKVDAGLSLVDTALKVRELGGVCVVAHPMSRGFGMNSATADTIINALKNPEVAEVLVGIEAYNGTAIDRISNHYARILAMRLMVANTGSSDAHILDTIGFGATEFEGNSAKDLLNALKNHTTKVRKIKEWSPFRVITSWGARYVENALTRFAWAVG